MTLIIVLIIAINATKLVIRTTQELLEFAPSGHNVEKLKESIEHVWYLDKAINLTHVQVVIEKTENRFATMELIKETLIRNDIYSPFIHIEIGAEHPSCSIEDPIIFGIDPEDVLF